MNVYAHSVAGRPVQYWEKLPVHLTEVADETAHRAAKFGCASLGTTLGQLHDFGKFKLAFQSYLHDPKVKDKGHSTAGAVYAIRHFGTLGKTIAHAVAGHHAGLKDDVLARDGRLDRNAGELDLALVGLTSVPSGFTLPEPPVPPTGLKPDGPGLSGFQFAFLIRMLFSCLVDADRFCTARFYAQFDERVVEHGPKATIGELSTRLTTWMKAKANERQENGEALRPVNQRRAEILASARDMLPTLKASSR
jgi:CRISPR-associated endonuclease/helicase Cas3